MTITKKIEREQFINKGGKPAEKEDKEFMNIALRIPMSLAQKMNVKLVEKPWMNRNQWIAEAIWEKISSD